MPLQVHVIADILRVNFCFFQADNESNISPNKDDLGRSIVLEYVVRREIPRLIPQSSNRAVLLGNQIKLNLWGESPIVSISFRFWTCMSNHYRN